MSLWLLFLTAHAFPATTVDGFVTRIDSPLSFEVGELHIILNARTNCALRIIAAKDTSFDPWKWTIPHTKLFLSKSDTTQTTIEPCGLLHSAIGSAVHLEGSLRIDTRAFIASSFVLITVRQSINLVGIALNEERVEQTRTSPPRKRELWLDGYPIAITRNSSLLPAPGNTSFSPALENNGAFKIDWGDINASVSATDLKRGTSTSPSENMWIWYRAIQTANGSIRAVDMRFWNNYVGKRQEEYTRQFAPVVEVPDYATRALGHVIFLHGDKATIVPDTGIQNWITKFGASVVPKDQQSLSSTDPAKVVFRFYVVQPFWAGHFLRYKYGFQNIDGTSCETGGEGDFGYSNPNGRSFMKDIVFTQNGVVLIPENVLGSLSNESELAALLSYGISSTIQNQFFRLWSITTYAPGVNLHTMSSNDLKLCAFVTRLNEQTLRLGIRQMYLAGYDIREAPFAWAVAQGKPVSNPIMNSKHPDQEIPWYAAYAFNYISQYYQNVDYSKLKRGRAEYQQFLKELYKADPSLPRPKAPN
ncbi:MAG: hypothetical protein ACYCPO_11540 [Acidobacteriaceae bacterium]